MTCPGMAFMRNLKNSTMKMGTLTFRRLLTLHQTKESLETQVISFPLLLKFRKRLEEKFGIYYEIGPAFDLISIQSNS